MKMILRLAILAGAAAAVAKVIGAKKSSWEGLTEPEVRSKVTSRLPDRMPDDKREAVTDKIVSKMKDQGMIREAADEAAAGETPVGTGSSAAETGEPHPEADAAGESTADEEQSV